MKIVLVLISVLVLGVFSDDITNEEADSIQNLDEELFRIVNGSKAVEGQFPYQAGLLLKKPNRYSWCSASLIGENWLITAAHCLANVANARVSLGSIRRNAGIITRTVASSCFYPHSDFGVTREAYDIALIYIPTVPFSDKIQPIKLPPIVPPYSDYVGNQVVIAGWGLTSNYTNIQPAILRYAQFNVIKNSDCKIRVNDNNICTDYTQAGTCVYDSGSGVTLVSNGLLIGVHVRGRKYCVVGKSGASMRITSFLEWIKNRTGIFYES